MNENTEKGVNQQKLLSMLALISDRLTACVMQSTETTAPSKIESGNTPLWQRQRNCSSSFIQLSI